MFNVFPLPFSLCMQASSSIAGLQGMITQQQAGCAFMMSMNGN